MPKPGYKLVKSLFGKEIEIPETWKICNLGDLLTKIQDGNYGESYPKESEFLDSGIPFIRGTEITKNFIDGKKVKYISKTKHDELQKAHIETGDVLFLNRGGITRTVAIVPPKYDDANIGPQLTLLRCNTKIIHNKYLYYFIQGENFKKQVISSDAGTALQFFGIEKTKKFKITLPEIREQQKIVSVLNSIDNLLSSYDKTIQTTQKLKKGLMQKLLTKGIDHKKFKKVPWLFGKEIEIPEEWEIKKIEDLFKLKSGSTPSRKIPEYFAGNIPWITSTDLNRSKITSTLEKITPEAVKQTNLKLLPKGTFLIATYGLEAAGTRGKCGITKMESTCNQACMAFLPSSEITSEFLFYFYLYFGEKIIFSIAQGTKQQNLYSDTLKKVSMFVPPQKEQKRIVNFLDQIDSHLFELESKKTGLDKIKKGLIQKLLTSKIRVKF